MASSKKTKSYRSVHVTINNPSISPDQAAETAQSFKSLTYCVLGLEVSPSGTPHLHIHLYFRSSVQESTLKKRFPGAHIERAKGTPQENRDYIQKTGKHSKSVKAKTVVPGSFREIGTCPERPKPSSKKSNAPTKSQGVLELIEAGKSNWQIFKEYPGFFRQQREVSQARTAWFRERSIKRSAPPEVTYLYGPPGSGKTQFVWKSHKERDIYLVTDYLNPYDGYHGEPVILFDMFQDLPKEFSLGDLVRVLGPHGVQLPARGQNLWACFTKVYFTSCSFPTEVFAGKNGPTLDSFLLRINNVIQMEAGVPTNLGSGIECKETMGRQDSPLILGGCVLSADVSAVA